MSFSEADVEFFAWLDEQAQAPEGLLVTTREGETRCVPFPSLAEFRTGRRARFPRLERARTPARHLQLTCSKRRREQ